MASSTKTLLPLSLLFTLLALSQATYPNFILTLVNNCPYTIWPAIQPNAGHPVLERGGFTLHSLTHRSFPAPTAHWSGRVWARTGCTYQHGKFYCATGDCGGRIECDGLGGAPPATLAQFVLHHGKGVCPVVGCKENLSKSCPAVLQFRSHGGHGPVVGCKSACEVFKTDEFCCRNHYNSPQTCKPSSYSQFFKHACPATFTYAHDSPSLMHECSSPRELKVIFCH
ncbi:hypothetical protein MTR67_049168 [Solanum verrucosum]|uniref:Osmotin-like protein n=1 Tax=Solanum verrucosum TaxID=315347 RepID=A0AAF0V2X0_SOLVR|nr:hypothetical protein MTR67_049168 [Solanum verrucosum]